MSAYDLKKMMRSIKITYYRLTIHYDSPLRFTGRLLLDPTWSLRFCISAVASPTLMNPNFVIGPSVKSRPVFVATDCATL
jgi:hypothetical protein